MSSSDAQPRLVFVYGPHAAGKLTTATEISRLTGYPLFHNHLTVTPVEAIFNKREPVSSEMKKALRLTLLAAAARERVSLVFTFAYSGAVDDEFVAAVEEPWRVAGGGVDFVQLYTPYEELLRRVSNESRKRLGKMSDPQRLQSVLKVRDQYAAVKFPRNLRLETMRQTPTQAAEIVIAHYGLPSVAQ